MPLRRKQNRSSGIQFVEDMFTCGGNGATMMCAANPNYGDRHYLGRNSSFEIAVRPTLTNDQLSLLTGDDEWTNAQHTHATPYTYGTKQSSTLLADHHHNQAAGGGGIYTVQNHNSNDTTAMHKFTVPEYATTTATTYTYTDCGRTRSGGTNTLPTLTTMDYNDSLQSSYSLVQDARQQTNISDHTQLRQLQDMHLEDVVHAETQHRGGANLRNGMPAGISPMRVASHRFGADFKQRQETLDEEAAARHHFGGGGALLRLGEEDMDRQNQDEGFEVIINTQKMGNEDAAKLAHRAARGSKARTKNSISKSFLPRRSKSKSSTKQAHHQQAQQQQHPRRHHRRNVSVDHRDDIVDVDEDDEGDDEDDNNDLHNYSYQELYEERIEEIPTANSSMSMSMRSGYLRERNATLNSNTLTDNDTVSLRTTGGTKKSTSKDQRVAQYDALLDQANVIDSNTTCIDFSSNHNAHNNTTTTTNNVLQEGTAEKLLRSIGGVLVLRPNQEPPCYLVANVNNNNVGENNGDPDAFCKALTKILFAASAANESAAPNNNNNNNNNNNDNNDSSQSQPAANTTSFAHSPIRSSKNTNKMSSNNKGPHPSSRRYRTNSTTAQQQQQQQQPQRRRKSSAAVNKNIVSSPKRFPGFHIARKKSGSSR